MSLQFTSKVDVNADLQIERAQCSFNVEEFAEWWHGGATGLRTKRDRDLYVLSDKRLVDDTPAALLSHKERYERSLEKGTIVMDRIRRLMNAYTEAEIRDNYLEILYANMAQYTGMMAAGTLTDGSPLGVHYGMFVPTLLGQGSDEQCAKWLMPAWRMELIGTYAQTELGHGTFLRGLQTTATFDVERDEFVLHSPSVSAYKWWPGGLGHSVNYATVMAQLFSNGQHHGLHPFLVQLRDTETWMPLPGVHLGDVGPKFGLQGVNNGFAGFDNVRLPRSAMLCRNARIERDGTFRKSPASVLTYGTLIFVRIVLPSDMAVILSRAATIATRYSVVRHQSPLQAGEAEPQILEHVTQQRKVLAQVAQALVFKLAAEHSWRMYLAVLAELRAGDLTRMGEIHALSCALKALTTIDAAAGVETLRLACGGHGYMMSSGLPTLYTMAVAACTYDGETTVMLLQTARYLLKNWRLAVARSADVQLPATVRYLRRVAEGREIRWTAAASSSLEGVLGALQTVAGSKIRLVCEHNDARIRAGHSAEVAANLTSIEMLAAAEAHALVYVVQTAIETTANVAKQVSGALALVIGQLVELYVLTVCQRVQADLIRFAGMSDADARHVQERIETLLTALRPNAVGIVDGFDHEDIILNSSLGAFDGRVYERLYEEAQHSTLNIEGISSEAIEKFMKPMMNSAKL